MAITLDTKVRTQQGWVGKVWALDRGWALVRIESKFGEFTTWEHLRDLGTVA